jgi:hypothetical protein
MTCIVPPNDVHFTELRKAREPRTSTSPLVPTQPNSPVIDNHVRIPEYPRVFADATCANIPTTSNAPDGSGITRQYALYFDSDGEFDNGEDQYDVKKLLDILHERYHALNFPQYEGQLRKHGIAYLVDASMVDMDFYVTRVGMVQGAASLFQEWVAKELRRADRARKRRKERKKRARVSMNDEDEENMRSPSVSGPQ